MSATPVVTTAGHLSQERQRAVSEAADVALSVMSVTVLASVAAHGVGASAFLNRKSKRTVG